VERAIRSPSSAPGSCRRQELDTYVLDRAAGQIVKIVPAEPRSKLTNLKPRPYLTSLNRGTRDRFEWVSRDTGERRRTAVEPSRAAEEHAAVAKEGRRAAEEGTAAAKERSRDAEERRRAALERSRDTKERTRATVKRSRDAKELSRDAAEG
jgi:hypothetical protein